MASLAEAKRHAASLYAGGNYLTALHVYDRLVAASPLDFEARIGVADCLVALDRADRGVAVYRAVAWYALRSGHPLATIALARVLESLGCDASDLLASLVGRYGHGSALLGQRGERISLPPGDTDVAVPDLRPTAGDELVEGASFRAATCLDKFDAYPESHHPIPLLSDVTPDVLRRLIATLLVHRLPHGTAVIRQGEVGRSFFFVAAGVVRVFASDAGGEVRELAKLGEGAIFGERALLEAAPRSASVAVVGEACLLEATRDSLAVLANELGRVAVALSRFTHQRVLGNLLATHRLFRPFSPPQRRELLRRFTRHEVAAGSVLIREGDEGHGLFVIVSGQVEVSKGEAPHQATRLAVLGPGAVVGEMSLLHEGPTTATVTAIAPCVVLFLSREYVSRIVAKVPEIRHYLEALRADRELDTQLALSAEKDAGEAAYVLL